MEETVKHSLLLQ